MPSDTLDELLKAIQNEKRVRIVPTDKNRATLFRLGIGYEDFNDLIHELEVSDYRSGPESDYNGSNGSIWKFKKKAFGEIFYIKIKYVKPLRVLSCHIDNIEL